MELLEQFKQREGIYENMPDKYINGMNELTRLNKKAIKADYNRQLDIASLVDYVCTDLGVSSPQMWHYKFPITFSMIHNDTEVRVIFSWGTGNAQLDMSFAEYDNLPSVKARAQVPVDMDSFGDKIR
tara:strand:- start:343 stop:723 length:381 start_codon:yes stop_codon:yes gene_type:complete